VKDTESNAPTYTLLTTNVFASFASSVYSPVYVTYTLLAVPIEYVFDSYLSFDEVGVIPETTSLYPSKLRKVGDPMIYPKSGTVKVASSFPFAALRLILCPTVTIPEEVAVVIVVDVKVCGVLSSSAFSTSNSIPEEVALNFIPCAVVEPPNADNIADPVKSYTIWVIVWEVLVYVAGP